MTITIIRRKNRNEKLTSKGNAYLLSVCFVPAVIAFVHFFAVAYVMAPISQQPQEAVLSSMMTMMDLWL